MTSRSQTSTNDQGAKHFATVYPAQKSIFAPQKHQASFPFRGHRGSIHHGIHRLRAAGTVQQGQLLAPGCVQGAEGGGEEDSLAVQSKKNQKEPLNIPLGRAASQTDYCNSRQILDLSRAMPPRSQTGLY